MALGYFSKYQLRRVFQNNIYFIISSNMTNSRPIAGFLVVLEPAALSSKIPFFLGQNIIGRSEPKATLVIKEPSISQKHAKLIASIHKTTIIDLNSKNGTKINNEDNYIESDSQVLIDNSMIIYFADAKCRIQMIETKQQSMNFQSVTIRVENKRKQNVGQKQQKIQKEVKVYQKVQKDEFKTTFYPSDYDLEEGFRGSQQVQQKQKSNKEQSKKNKKNTKSKPQLNTKTEQANKAVRNIQQQQKNKKEKNSPLKNKRSEQNQSAAFKKPPKKEIKEEKRKSSQAVQKNVRFEEQNNYQKKQKDAQNKVKNQQISKDKHKFMNDQLLKTSKQRQDNEVRKKYSKKKRQSKVIQNEQKGHNKQVRNKQKNDLNQTIVQEQAKKRKHSQQTSLENSGDTTKKKIKMAKKLPSQSLQRELRQLAKRSIVGKRVLFSGFIPKMRRKYFILVQDYNEEFDYLVMKQYTRTFKALLAISKGIMIVKYSWIEESQQSLRTLHVNNYLFSKIQPIYQAIERAKNGQKIFKGYQLYLLSEQYHLRVPQIQTLTSIVGGQTKTIKGQVKIKDPKKCIAILRNKQQNALTAQLKNEIGKAKKCGFELIYNIEFLLDACEKQEINWQNSKL